MKSSKHCAQELFCERAHFLFFLIILFSANFCFSQKAVTLLVNGYGAGKDATAPVSFEWNESWLAEGNPFEYNHNIARATGALSTIAYSDGSASGALLEQAYSRLGFEKENTEFFYTINYEDEEFGINQTAFSFAAKKTLGGQNLVFVVVRGTPGTLEEWLSNLNVNDSGKKNLVYHEGFYTATTQIMQRFEKFVEDKNIDLKNSVVVVTGHSRGAAVANLFSALLAEQEKVRTGKIFAYTFAAPNTTLRSDAGDEKFGFIWNIINSEDLVPTVPPNNKTWNFTKFGKSRVIINSWNCGDENQYVSEFVPKMNKLYSSLLGREYSPFGSGSFIGTKLSDTLSSINRDAAHFYKGIFPLHNKMAVAMKSVFPTAQEALEALPSDEPGTLDKIINMVKDRSKTRTKILIDYYLNAMVDMHAMQEYLAWLFTLDEDSMYAQQQSTIVYVNGIFNGAVVDKQGKVYARIYDGVLKMSETKQPLAAWQIPIGNFGAVFIGFPSHEDYSLLIYKDSVFPTPVRVRVDRYGSDGIKLSTVSEKLAGPHYGVVYNFAAGVSTLLQEDGSQAVYKKLRKKEAKTAIKDGALKENDIPHATHELHFDTDGLMEFGVTTGLQKIYAGIFIGADLLDLASTQVFSMGLGSQHSFCGPLILGVEVLAKFPRCKTEENSWEFAIVPAARFLLTIRPLRRFQIFTAFEMDFCIEGKTSKAFDCGYRKGGIPPAKCSDTVKLYPSFQFGMKL